MFTFDEHVYDLTTHIRRVQDNALFLARRFADTGRDHDARVLMARAYVHDASKWNGIEWEYLHRGPDVPKDMLMKAVAQHQATNDHHPQFHGGLHLMPRIAVAEMTCDWLARSQELGTDIRDWVRTIAASKFEFDRAPEQARWISEYLELLLPKKFA